MSKISCLLDLTFLFNRGLLDLLILAEPALHQLHNPLASSILVVVLRGHLLEPFYIDLDASVLEVLIS